jgi:Cu/Ag efflux protein CusF
MNHKLSFVVPVVLSAAFLAACGQQKTPEAAAMPAAESKSESPEMAPAESPMPQGMQMGEKSEGQAHNAKGKITAVDAAAGSVTIAHDAVASAGWPAMTMTFKLADPKSAATLHANDNVQFAFTLDEKGEATVTTISAAAADGM